MMFEKASIIDSDNLIKLLLYLLHFLINLTTRGCLRAFINELKKMKFYIKKSKISTIKKLNTQILTYF